MAKRERDCLPHKENGFCSSDFCLAKIKSLAEKFKQNCCLLIADAITVGNQLFC